MFHCEFVHAFVCAFLSQCCSFLLDRLGKKEITGESFFCESCLFKTIPVIYQKAFKKAYTLETTS